MKTNALLLLFSIVILATTPYVCTRSFLNDISVSSENTFSALSISPSITPTPTVEAPANHIVISEVQISGASANQDFVELYNPTNQTINISNWKIRKKTSTGTISTLAAIPTGKIIATHGFFLWSNNQNGYDSNLVADISNANTLSDNNSIELQDVNSISIDQVGWGVGTNQFVEGDAISVGPVSSQSIERKAFISSTTGSMSLGGQDEFQGNGSDTNNNQADFIVRTQSQPQNTQSSVEPL